MVGLALTRRPFLLLPALVIMDMLGAPREELERLKRLSDEMALFIGSARDAPEKYQRAGAATREMADLFRELITARRAAPPGAGSDRSVGEVLRAFGRAPQHDVVHEAAHEEDPAAAGFEDVLGSELARDGKPLP